MYSEYIKKYFALNFNPQQMYKNINNGVSALSNSPRFKDFLIQSWNSIKTGAARGIQKGLHPDIPKVDYGKELMNGFNIALNNHPGYKKYEQTKQLGDKIGKVLTDKSQSSDKVLNDSMKVGQEIEEQGSN